MRKICVVTGTRAEYGILSGLMAMLAKTRGVELQVIATNMHLSHRHGYTIDEIRADGFNVDYAVDLGLDENTQDSPRVTTERMGMALAGIGIAFESLQPDIVLILGDRYEMLAAASAATVFGIPVAHFHGGEITEGAYDDAIRHAITKLSTYHFASTEEYAQRIIQMGEEPDRVFNVGSLGVDNIHNTPKMTLEELSESIGFDLSGGYLLVTYHPVTRQPGEESRQTEALLRALEKTDKKILFTLPNSDAGGDRVAALVKQWCAAEPGKRYAVASLGRKRYYAALSHCLGVVGNSSSGLIEAPSFRIPTLDIGIRQRGRVRGNTVVSCGDTQEEIEAGLAKILDYNFFCYCLEHAENPYYKERVNAFYLEGATQRAYEKLLELPVGPGLIKRFHDIDF